MKRFGVIAVVVAAVFAVSSGASASTTRTLGYRHACTHGQMRCFALIETANGSDLNPMTAAPSVAPAAYGPRDYHTAYHLPNKTPKRTDGTRKAVTVAIVDAFDDASIYQDLTRYSKIKGIKVLPQCSTKIVKACFHKRNLGARAGSAVATGWDVEIALDVETVHAICENCRIDLFEAKNARTASLGAAENVAANHANIISNSFGMYGNDGKGTSAQNAPFSHPNKAIVVAAGDFGYGVAFPASLNTVISVGGTRLLLGLNHSYASEAVWGQDCSASQCGSGSGCADGSASGLPPVTARAFQENVANYANTGCGSFRGDNDVSANGDPFSGSAVYAHSTGWLKVGGTSLSTPLIAATYALAANAASVKFPASMLYAQAGTSAFHDVSTGNDNNGNWVALAGGAPCDTSKTACEAAPGYDLPTGVGTPNGLAGF